MMKTSSLVRLVLVGLSVGIAACGSAKADAAKTTGILTGNLAEGTPREKLWSVPLLYRNPANPYLQELTFQGQLQLQYAYGSDDAGQYGSGEIPDDYTWGNIDVRRFRLGMKALMFNSVKFHSLLDLYPDFSPEVYKGIAEAYLAYSVNEAFTLGLGKTEVKFTREMEISSREILPFERSQLVNLFYSGELSGAWISGKGIAGGWLYELGAYSNDITREFTDFGGGTVVLTKVGYNYTHSSGLDFAQAEFHYQHNSEPGYAGPKGASPAYSDGIAISNEVTEGRFNLTTEAFWGDGSPEAANTGGFTAMPTWFLSEKLQLVTTFQLAGSSGDQGIPLPKRYEQLVPDGKTMNGDTYFAGYAGLNYYFYGHKLKVMSGVKYSSMTGGDEDFSGWTWLAGFRTCF
jgi:phosphate-selective porin OprO/OprP